MPLVCESRERRRTESITVRHMTSWADSSRADMLSTVQSSMSAGQDPTQTLSRLMDWAEAREVSS